MKNTPLIVSIGAFVLAVVLAIGTALTLDGVLERRTVSALRSAFDAAGLTWVQIAPDGLRANLSGTAPTESARIRALQIADSVIDASRVAETITVPVSNAVVAPVYRVEMMRNRNTVSVIGLVPATQDGGPISARLAAALPDARIEDMLQTSDHAVPGGWVAAVNFAIDALGRIDVGRISVAAGRIEVSALVDSPEAGASLETALRAIAPRGQVLALTLTAPRPVAAPFLLRVEMVDGKPSLQACSADTQGAHDTIAAALVAAGMTRRPACPLALGSPSPRWGEAAGLAIAALAELHAGNLTISDGDVRLVVPHTVPQADFDRIVGALETALPDAFVLNATRLDPPVQVNAAATAPEVAITLSEAGALSVSGRLPDARIRAAVDAFARARFGADQVSVAARVDDTLPQGWSVRVLTAIEALAELHHGTATVDARHIAIDGVSGNPDAQAQVTQVLAQGLGANADFSANVTYDQALDPVVQTPTPDQCETRIQNILAATKITFDPGSIEINAAAGQVIDRIAEVLRGCGELPFEVAGYTDSQGRDQTNQNLSQSRAEAVINALLARRVLVASLVAHGYGAADPVADNGTAQGREANRRIEFHLIRPAPEPVPIDPALEAQLVFDIQTPTDTTIRPRPRPGTQQQQPAAPQQGSGD